MRVFLPIALGCDVMLPLAILVNSQTVRFVISLYVEFVTQLLGKMLLNEDRTFQDALNVAVADEVASKESLEAQNDAKPGDQSVHSMGNSRNLLNQQNRKPSLPSFQKYSYACYSCGSTEHSK